MRLYSIKKIGMYSSKSMSATGTFFKDEAGEYMDKQLDELSELVKTQTKKYMRENLKELVDLFRGEEFSKELIKSINDDVDIPLLNEKTEKKIFRSLYNLVAKHIEKVIMSVHQKI